MTKITKLNVDTTEAEIDPLYYHPSKLQELRKVAETQKEFMRVALYNSFFKSVPVNQSSTKETMMNEEQMNILVFKG